MKIDDLEQNLDHSQMEIISEQDIPFDVDPREINKQLVIAAKFFSGLAVADKKKKVLANQKEQVLAWFMKQEEAIEKQEEFLRSKLELALYAAEQNGDPKPKIKTWAGTAFLSERTSTKLYPYLSNTHEKVIKFAKKHNLEVELIEKVSINDVKRVLKNEPKEIQEEFLQTKKTKSITIRLDKD